MTAFKSYRVVHEFTQTNPAPPEKVFPLLCPVREAEWLPGWRYDLIHSDSGIAELGCVFTTPNPTLSTSQAQSSSVRASETTWIVTDYQPAAFRIAFVWINPGMIITEIAIQLTPAGDGATRSHIRYRYTGLTPDGNCELAGYSQRWFEEKMINWEKTINHYLSTGKRVSVRSDS